MRTEVDLRTALLAREDLAPDPVSVMAGARRAMVRRRRRTGLMLTAAAVAATVVVVVALPVVVARGLPGRHGAVAAPTSTAPVPDPGPTDPAGQVPSDPRPPFSFTIRPGLVAGLEIRPVSLDADIQIAAIRAAGGSQDLAMLFVYRPGATVRAGWDVAGGPTAVPLNGATAWYSVDGAKTALRWEHVPGGWAVIVDRDGPAMAEATLVGLAQAIRFTEPYPAKVPYRTTYLPAGLTPFHVLQDTAGPAGRESVVQFADAAGGPGALDITVLDGPPSTRGDWRPDTTVAGRPAHWTTLVDGRRCVVDFGGYTVDVGTGTVSRADVERVIAGLDMAVWSDTGTWYDVATALPGR